MNLTLVTEITDSLIDKAFEKIQKIHWGGWTNEDFLLGLGNVDNLRLNSKKFLYMFVIFYNFHGISNYRNGHFQENHI